VKIKKPKLRPTQEQHRIGKSSISPSLAAAKIQNGLQQAVRCLPIVATCWFLFATLELAFNVLISTSPLRIEQLPLGARIFLLCYSLTVLNIFLALIVGSLKLVNASSQRLTVYQRKFRWLTDSIPIVVVGFFLLVYAGSWATYWQIGAFVGSGTILFMAPNPVQVFHWVDRDAALAVISLASVLTFATSRIVPRWVYNLHPATQTNIVRGWVGATIVCLLGAFFGEIYSTWGQRQYMGVATLYQRSVDNSAGPLPFILTEMRRLVQGRAENPSGSKDIQILQRPIVSMEQYRATAQQHDLKRWNVIVLIVESLRADQLRLYGGSRDVMPAADNLAHEARVFLNAYTQSSHTSYATIVPLSSHYPLRSATPYTYPEKPTYPRVLIYDVLKSLGYKTAIFSSSNEYWLGMNNYLDTGNLDRFLHAANFEGPTYVIQGDSGFADWVRRTKHAGSINDRFTVDEALRWIDGLERKDPFFFSVTFQSSHLPYPVPPDFHRRFGPDKIDFKIRFAHFPREKTQTVKDIYADSLAYVDSQIARLLDHLKKSDLWEQTVIVLTSDHGQAFYEHGFAAHGGPLFDEVMKVPLIIRAPGLPASLDARPAQHVDIPPTILGLLGLRPHPSFQGIDLIGTEPNPNRSVYMVAQTPLTYQYGIVRSNYKLIYDQYQRQYSLYDLQYDPGERNDITASQPSVVQELSKRLLTWHKQQIDYYNDATLHSREYPPILAD
jgi:arylsulfatase